MVERIGELLPDRQARPTSPGRSTTATSCAGCSSALPPRQRAAVVLRYFHDLSDQQVADELGCRATTVRSLISRALSTLRAATGGSDQQGDLR